MVNIKSMTVYDDASGAPATIECGAYVFAMDYIAGEPRLRAIAGPQGHNRGLKKSVALALHAYSAELRKRLATDFDRWVGANVEMYAD